MEPWLVPVAVAVITGLAGGWVVWRARVEGHSRERIAEGDRAVQQANQLVEWMKGQEQRERRVDALDERVEHESRERQTLQRELLEYKEQARKEFVGRDEFVVAVSRFERKLDEIGKHLLQLASKS